MNDAREANRQAIISTSLQAAQLLERLFIERPSSQERFSVDQKAAISWVLQNSLAPPAIASNNPASAATTLATLQIPNNWLNNFLRAVESAELIIQALLQLHKINNNSLVLLSKKIVEGSKAEAIAKSKPIPQSQEPKILNKAINIAHAAAEVTSNNSELALKLSKEQSHQIIWITQNFPPDPAFLVDLNKENYIKVIEAVDAAISCIPRLREKLISETGPNSLDLGITIPVPGNSEALDCYKPHTIVNTEV